MASPLSHIGLPDIVGSHTHVTVDSNPNLSGSLFFEPKLLPGTKIPYPGFPSLNVLPIQSVQLEKIGLNCFGSPSKHPNTILSMYVMPELVPIETLADSILGKSLFVNWPNMHEAKAVAISDTTKEIRTVSGGKTKSVVFTSDVAKQWSVDAKTLEDTYRTGNGLPGSGGVLIGEVKIRLKVLPLQGMKTNPSTGARKKLFGRQEADVPLQLCLMHAPAPDPRFIEHGPIQISDRFPVKSSVILTKGKYRGCSGEVVSVIDQKNVAVNVSVVPPEKPFGLAIAKSMEVQYVSSQDAAKALKLHPGVFGKITGRLQFEQGRYDLGLNLKGDGLCVVGYTRKKVDNPSLKGKTKKTPWAAGDAIRIVGSQALDDDGDEQEKIYWEYSRKAIHLVDSYRNKFPKLFSSLGKMPSEKRYNANKVFGSNGESVLPTVREWLNSLETAKLPRTPVSTYALTHEAVAAVEKAASIRLLALKKNDQMKESLIKIPSSALYREGVTGATDVLEASDLNDGESPRLGDRIVNLCADGLPFGERGTVVGIHEAATTGSVEVVMDEEFIGGTTLQGACSNFRGKLCLWAHLLKVSPKNSDEFIEQFTPNVTAAEGSKTKQSGAVQQNMTAWKQDNVPAATQVARASTSQEARTGSTGRGKQGAWREAKGPDSSGDGFHWKTKRRGTGLKKWKSTLKDRVAKREEAKSNTAELKAMLRIKGPPKILQSTVHSDRPATEELKSLLGVQSIPSATPTRSLPAAPLPEQAPSSAADRLMQLMATKKTVAPMSLHTQPSTAFNFTYTEAGKEASVQCPTIHQTQPCLTTQQQPYPSQLPDPDQFPPLGGVVVSEQRNIHPAKNSSETLVPSVVASRASSLDL